MVVMYTTFYILRINNSEEKQENQWTQSWMQCKMQELEKSTLTKFLTFGSCYILNVDHLEGCIHCSLPSTQANGRFILTYAFQITETGKGKVENCTPVLVSSPKWQCHICLHFISNTKSHSSNFKGCEKAKSYHVPKGRKNWIRLPCHPLAHFPPNVNI